MPADAATRPPLPDWAARAAVAEPRDLAEARDAVAGGGALLPRGAGTKLDWGAVPERADLVVSSARLDRVVAHDPGDATATVQAGVPLRALQERLRPAGQWLAVDPPSEAAGATVGGVFAAGEAGPRRLRYGTMRDLVIGTTAVLADGTVSRSGGKVIKNVAGYDLGKLLCGSLGTLALVVELTVRLHPLPAASVTVRVRAGAAGAGRLALALLAAPLEPVAVDWAGPPGGEGTLLARFAGRADAVDAQVEAARRLAGGAGLGSERLGGEAGEAAWDGHATALAAAGTVVRGATLPSELPAAAEALAAAARGAGVGATLRSHAALGLHDALLSGGDAAGHARVVRDWRAALALIGGHAVVRRRLAGVEDRVDVWGADPPGLGLMRAVKERLDPARRCAPGRFVGGL